jgi:hypothetical protein
MPEDLRQMMGRPVGGWMWLWLCLVGTCSNKEITLSVMRSQDHGRAGFCIPGASLLASSTRSHLVRLCEFPSGASGK